LSSFKLISILFEILENEIKHYTLWALCAEEKMENILRIPNQLNLQNPKYKCALQK
jgi:hypothetical protein